MHITKTESSGVIVYWGKQKQYKEIIIEISSAHENKNNKLYQIISNFYDVDAEIEKKGNIQTICGKIIEKSGLNLFNERGNPLCHQFSPYGVTYMAGLKESHLIVHTWPETQFVSIDIYSCEGKEKAEKAYKLFIEKLRPSKIEKIIYK
ncbi:MAG: S-adenosylmethionine decarboxylase [Candidatus Pacearchaeota archaeon]